MPLLQSGRRRGTKAARPRRAETRVSVASARLGGACLQDTALSEATSSLADALHAMYLVTMIAKIQVKATPYQQSAVAPAVGAREAVAIDSPPAARAVVDERWLAAVTQCRSVRTTLDDVAKVAAAFPQYLRVRWNIVEGGVARPRGVTHDVDDDGGGGDDGTRVLSSSRAPTGDLGARVYLLSDHVPSAQEAASALRTSWRAAMKDGDDEREAEQAWLKRYYEGVTAYKAWRAQKTTPLCDPDGLVEDSRHVGTSGRRAKAQRIVAEKLDSTDIDGQGDGSDHPCHIHPSCLTTHNHNLAVTHVKRSRGQGDGIDGKATASAQQEDRMLRSMSAELRASLSEAKLRGVVRQMCRDEAQVEAREQERIERVRDREQLLRTYEHVLSLFGRKHTVCNAAQLLRALTEQEGDGHGDYRATCRRVQLLLQAHAATGLSAMTGGTQDPPRAVSDLTSLSPEELQWTLITLHRDKAAISRLAGEFACAGLSC